MRPCAHPRSSPLKTRKRSVSQHTSLPSLPFQRGTSLFRRGCLSCRMTLCLLNPLPYEPSLSPLSHFMEQRTIISRMHVRNSLDLFLLLYPIHQPVYPPPTNTSRHTKKHRPSTMPVRTSRVRAEIPFLFEGRSAFLEALCFFSLFTVSCLTE